MLAWFGDLLTQRRRGAEKRRGIQGDELSTPRVSRRIKKPFSLRLCESFLVRSGPRAARSEFLGDAFLIQEFAHAEAQRRGEETRDPGG
jgi:hypothetical protein